VRIEKVNGQDDLILTGLDKLEEPFTLVKLTEQVGARMPRVDLPDILLEVATRTGFTKEFTHISERDWGTDRIRAKLVHRATAGPASAGKS